MGNHQNKVIDIRTGKPVEEETRNSVKDEIVKALKEVKKEQPKDNIGRQKKLRKGTNESAENIINNGSARNIFNIGNNSGNVIGSIGDNAKIISKITKVVKSPPPDTIGAKDHLIRIINDEIKKLAHTRQKDWVKTGKYPDEKTAKGPAIWSVINGLRHELGIPKRDTRRIDYIIKEMNNNRFDEIMEYLRDKYSKTVTGRIKGSVKKKKSSTPFYELMQTESALLKKINLKSDSPEVHNALRRYYGVTSHKDLVTYQHKDWISRIETIVDHVERGVLHIHDINL